MKRLTVLFLLVLILFVLTKISMAWVFDDQTGAPIIKYRAPTIDTGYLLLETGDKLLMEDNSIMTKG